LEWSITTVSAAPAGAEFSGVKVLLSSDRRQLGPLATSSMRGGTQHAGVSFWKPSCYAGAGIHDIQLERVDKIGDRFFEAASRRLVAHFGGEGHQ
jgi:hypothetical protein